MNFGVDSLGDITGREKEKKREKKKIRGRKPRKQEASLAATDAITAGGGEGEAN